MVHIIYNRYNRQSKELAFVLPIFQRRAEVLLLIAVAMLRRTIGNNRLYIAIKNRQVSSGCPETIIVHESEG